MTHEYVIATGGRIDADGADGADGADAPTAIAWAADHVLAVGRDAEVRAISRGDSTFLDLEGCVVTALPDDLARAQAVVETEAAGHGAADIGTVLVRAGLLDPSARPQLGAPADLAFWGPVGDDRGGQPGVGLLAVVRGGAFSAGDEHRGPFHEPPRPTP